MTTPADTIELDRPRVLVRPWPAIAAAMTAGVAVDLLAWGRPGGPGLSVALVSIVAATVVTIRIHGSIGPPIVRLLTAAVVMAVVPMIRASPVLIGLSVFAWAVLVAVAVARSRDRSGTTWVMTRYVRAGFEWALASAEPVRMAFAELEGVRASSLSFVRRGLPLLRGLALSWIVLVFFTVLLSAADPIFGGIVAETLDIDLSPDRVIRFAVVAGGAAWLVLGLSRRAIGTATPRIAFRPSSFGATEALAVVGSLNLLFAGFLAVQFTYLFDGRVGRVDIGYAQYARQGFFELVFAAACVLSLILSVDWIVARRVRVLDLLHLGLIVQTLVVTWSAVVRMLAYTTEFGLSELRVYTTAFMAWIAVMMVLAAVTVLRSRRDSFAFGAFVTGLVAIVALVAVNPDGFIAQTNLARSDSEHGVDIAYLGTLSADAVPAMAAAVDAADPHTRRALETSLESTRAELQTRADTLGWRSWSLAHHRAFESIPD
jgi:hypothetical protein